MPADGGRLRAERAVEAVEEPKLALLPVVIEAARLVSASVENRVVEKERSSQGRSRGFRLNCSVTPVSIISSQNQRCDHNACLFKAS